MTMRTQANYGTVDFHAHPVDDVFRREMEFLGLDPMAEDGFPLPDWSASAHLQFMEDAGIDYTVLSVPTLHIHNGDDEKSCASARRINESTAKLCAEYPEPVALDMLRMVAEDSHIVFGSDFPHSSAKVIIGKKKHLENNEQYRDLVQRIFRENAAHLLR